MCFNLTFGAISVNGRDACYLWHEEIAGRDGCDVASAILAFLTSQPQTVRNIRISADNCAPQNKNWVLYSSVMSLLCSTSALDSVTNRYLERGHTYMKPDSIHGAIGRRLRRENEVLEFSDLTNLISKSMSGLEIRQLVPADFIPLVSCKDAKVATFPKLRMLKEVHFEKNSKFFFYKYSIDAHSYFKRPFVKDSVPSLPNSSSRPRGISSKKKDNICHALVPLMPESKRCFWTNLKVAQVDDLCNCNATNTTWLSLCRGIILSFKSHF